MENKTTPGKFLGQLKGIANRVRSRPPESTEELMDVFKSVNDSGLVSNDVKDILERAVASSKLRVRDVMVPRRKMITVPYDTDLKTVLKVVVPSGHSRFPVIDERKDKITGILLAKDILQFCGNHVDEEFDLHELIRSPVFVPESKRLNTLLNEFRKERNHMAIVVDEFAGIAGLITIEDVLEEIVGEIEDESDPEADEMIRSDPKIPDGYIVDALTELHEFNRALGVNFEEDVDTVGGLLVKTAGHVPEKNDTVALGGLNFTVLKSNPRRIELIGVVPLK